MTENFAPISWIAKTIYVPRMGSSQSWASLSMSRRTKDHFTEVMYSEITNN